MRIFHETEKIEKESLIPWIRYENTFFENK